MTDINIVVDAVRQLNEVWKLYSAKSTVNGSVPKDVYGCLYDVDLAVANLIDKVGEAAKAITINAICK